MKLRKIPVCLILFCLCTALLWGCTQVAPLSSQQSDAEYASVLSALPDGFIMEKQGDGSYAILQDGLIIGGFVRTSLTPEDMDLFGTPEPEAFRAYLESYVEPPLVLEYMAESGYGPEIVVSLVAYDIQARQGHEFRHYIFPRDSVYYDLWLDTELVSTETEQQILDASGITLP